MINWPKSLIREIAARRCVFFLGAGISASAADIQGNRPKTWSEFMAEACDLVHEDQRDTIKNLIDKCNYLLALQGIRNTVDPGDFRSLLDTNFNNPLFQPSDLHRLINELDSRIVVTTNFDRIYEKYCIGAANAEAFKVINYYSSDLCDELRSDTRLIVKAHGSIDEIKKMVFTRAEYHKARRDHPQFYEVLKALFLTHTVVFIGCGLEDPDVLLLLEDVQIVSSSERPHYVLTKTGMKGPTLWDWKATYNLDAFEYGESHEDLYGALEDLVEAVEAERADTGVA